MEQSANWYQSCWSYADPNGKAWVEWVGELKTYMFKYEWKVEADDDIERDR
jgi:hypothetical protein